MDSVGDPTAGCAKSSEQCVAETGRTLLEPKLETESLASFEYQVIFNLPPGGCIDIRPIEPGEERKFSSDVEPPRSPSNTIQISNHRNGAGISENAESRGIHEHRPKVENLDTNFVEEGGVIAPNDHQISLDQGASQTLPFSDGIRTPVLNERISSLKQLGASSAGWSMCSSGNGMACKHTYEMLPKEKSNALKKECREESKQPESGTSSSACNIQELKITIASKEVKLQKPAITRALKVPAVTDVLQDSTVSNESQEARVTDVSQKPTVFDEVLKSEVQEVAGTGELQEPAFAVSVQTKNITSCEPVTATQNSIDSIQSTDLGVPRVRMLTNVCMICYDIYPDDGKLRKHVKTKHLPWYFNADIIEKADKSDTDLKSKLTPALRMFFDSGQTPTEYYLLVIGYLLKAFLDYLLVQLKMSSPDELISNTRAIMDSLTPGQLDIYDTFLVESYCVYTTAMDTHSTNHNTDCTTSTKYVECAFHWRTLLHLISNLTFAEQNNVSKYEIPIRLSKLTDTLCKSNLTLLGTSYDVSMDVRFLRALNDNDTKMLWFLRMSNRNIFHILKHHRKFTTPLQFCLANGKLKAASLLLCAGCSVEEKDKEGMTALVRAVKQRYLPGVQCVLPWIDSLTELKAAIAMAGSDRRISGILSDRASHITGNEGVCEEMHRATAISGLSMIESIFMNDGSCFKIPRKVTNDVCPSLDSTEKCVNKGRISESHTKLPIEENQPPNALSFPTAGSSEASIASSGPTPNLPGVVDCVSFPLDELLPDFPDTNKVFDLLLPPHTDSTTPGNPSYTPPDSTKYTSASMSNPVTGASTFGVAPQTGSLQSESGLSASSAPRLSELNISNLNQTTRPQATPCNGSKAKCIMVKKNTYVKYMRHCPLCNFSGCDIDANKEHVFSKHLPWYFRVHYNTPHDDEISALGRQLKPLFGNLEKEHNLPWPMMKILGLLLDDFIQELAKYLGFQTSDDLIEYIARRKLYPPCKVSLQWHEEISIKCHKKFVNQASEEISVSPPRRTSDALHWWTIAGLLGRTQQASKLRTFEAHTAIDLKVNITNNNPEPVGDVAKFSNLQIHAKLHDAINSTDIVTLWNLLERFPKLARANFDTKKKSSILAHAISGKTFASATILLLHGARVDQTDGNNQTILKEVASRGKEERVKFLLNWNPTLQVAEAMSIAQANDFVNTCETIRQYLDNLNNEHSDKNSGSFRCEANDNAANDSSSSKSTSKSEIIVRKRSSDHKIHLKETKRLRHDNSVHFQHDMCVDLTSPDSGNDSNLDEGAPVPLTHIKPITNTCASMGARSKVTPPHKSSINHSYSKGQYARTAGKVRLNNKVRKHLDMPDNRTAHLPLGLFRCQVCQEIMNSGSYMRHCGKTHLPWFIAVGLIDNPDGLSHLKRSKLSGMLLHIIHNCVKMKHYLPRCVSLVWGCLIHGFLDRISKELNLLNVYELAQYIHRRQLSQCGDKHVEITQKRYQTMINSFLDYYNDVNQPSLNKLTLDNVSNLLCCEKLMELTTKIAHNKGKTLSLSDADLFTWNKDRPALPSMSGPSLQPKIGREIPAIEMKSFSFHIMQHNIEALESLLDIYPNLVLEHFQQERKGLISHTLAIAQTEEKGIQLAIMFLLKGAHIDAQDINGNTALHEVVANGREKTAEFLLNWDARKPSAPVVMLVNHNIMTEYY